MKAEMSGEQMPEEKKESVKHYLDIFKRLRDEYSNEVPEEIIHSTSDNNKFKIRRGWFASLVGEFDMFAEDYLQNSEDEDAKLLVVDIEKFIVDYTSREFQNLERIDVSNVEEADLLLSRVIDHLENLQNAPR